MTDYPYEPPDRTFSDTLLAFRDMQLASRWSVRVEDDPLGPVNKVVTLMQCGQRVRSVLTPVAAGATVRAVYDAGTPLIFWGPTWQELAGHSGPEREPFRPATWCVEVDGRRVLEVLESDTWPAPAVIPAVPLQDKMRRVLRKQWRFDTARIAARLGFHRADDCPGWDG